MAVINAYGMKDSDGNTVKFRDDSGGGGGSANSVRATYETSPTTNPYSEGDYIYYNDTLYVAKTSIAVNTTLVVDTNIEDPDLPDDTIVSIDGLPGSGSGGTVAANDVSFDNATSGLPATEVQTAIDDIDAEVDDIVNVYGSKNLLPNKAVSQTINGVTFTVNADGSVSTSGTSGSGATWLFCTSLYDWTNSLQAGVIYKANGCPIGADSSINICLWNEAAWVRVFAGQDVSFTKPSSIHRNVRLAIGTDSSNVNFDGLTFYPMVRLASIVDSTYMPYSMTNQQITKRLSGQSNRNLLDNPFFTVNQRGQSSYTGSGYTVDRWILLDANATVTPVSGGVTITSASNSYWTIGQKFETKYTGNVFTVSVNVDGVIHSFTFTSGFDGSSQNDGTIWVWLTTEGFVYIGQAYSTTITIRAVKLELGSESTLAYDVAPDYAEELLKCQRYQVVYEQVGTFLFETISANIIAQSSTTAYGFISLPVPMRATPAITISTGGVIWSDESNSFTVSALSQLKLTQNSLKIEVTSSGLTVGKSYHLMLNQGGKMILDSNL